MIALDTETTGVDFVHGCRPYFVGIADDSVESELTYWEWRVDPLTRRPSIPQSDIDEIVDSISSHGHVILHNAKFDIRALASIGIDLPSLIGWQNIEDTVLLSHIIHSLGPHSLKYLAEFHCDIGIEDEECIKEASNQARNRVKTSELQWDIARRGHPHFPAVERTSWWKMDMWLPREYAIQFDYEDNHPWYTVLSDYGALDPLRTMKVYQSLKPRLPSRHLELYELRHRLLEVTYHMESQGITLHRRYPSMLLQEYEQVTAQCVESMERSVGEAFNPRSPAQLAAIIYEHFDAPPLDITEAGNYSTKSETLKRLLEGDISTVGVNFIENILDYRSSTKALEYITSYLRSTVRKRCRKTKKSYRLLHPNFNITGTRTTRFSSSNPNAQNISKQEDYNLRRCFGPRLTRYWVTADYSNIEMRIIAAESGDKKLMADFDEGKSFHLIVSEILHPKLFKILGPEKFKKTEEYRHVKNGNFALNYGASRRKADATYKVSGAYDKIRKRLPLIDKFMEEKGDQAVSAGYIETLGGYPLRVPSEAPYKAVNYFVQGSAGIFISKAMVYCHEYLCNIPDHYIIMQVHDELVFDFPLPVNEFVIMEIIERMEKAALDYGVRVPVEHEIIRNNWGEG